MCPSKIYKNYFFGLILDCNVFLKLKFFLLSIATFSCKLNHLDYTVAQTKLRLTILKIMNLLQISYALHPLASHTPTN